RAEFACEQFSTTPQSNAVRLVTCRVSGPGINNSLALQACYPQLGVCALYNDTQPANVFSFPLPQLVPRSLRFYPFGTATGSLLGLNSSPQSITFAGQFLVPSARFTTVRYGPPTAPTKFGCAPLADSTDTAIVCVTEA